MGAPGAHGIGDRLQLPPLVGKRVAAATAGGAGLPGEDGSVLVDTNDMGKQTGASLANAFAASGKEYLESVYAAEVAYSTTVSEVAP